MTNLELNNPHQDSNVNGNTLAAGKCDPDNGNISFSADSKDISVPKVGITLPDSEEDIDDSFSLLPKPTPHIPTNEEERHHVEAVHGCNSWQCKVVHILHSKYVQYSLMGLLLLDVVILFIELFLAAHYPLCSFVVRDAISCCPISDSNITAFSFTEGDTMPTCEANTALEGSSHERNRNLEEQHSSLCEAGYEAYQCPAACDEHKYESVHHAEAVLFYGTVLILCIFLIELITLMICLKPRVFFQKSFYVLDLVVVVVSLVLELFFHVNTDESFQNLVGIIILARLWRFIRIGHGLVEVTHEYASRKHDKLVKYATKLETLLVENDIELPPKTKHQMSHLKRMDL
jgi:hypothetical protein